MQSTQTIAPARAFCGTCDGLGLVGDDDPLRYPTPCPMCGGAGGGEPERDEVSDVGVTAVIAVAQVLTALAIAVLS